MGDQRCIIRKALSLMLVGCVCTLKIILQGGLPSVTGRMSSLEERSREWEWLASFTTSKGLLSGFCNVRMSYFNTFIPGEHR